jgi:hypothetical protein
MELIGRRDFTFVENDLNTLRGGSGAGFRTLVLAMHRDV